VQNELAGYIINYNGSKGCCICFAVKEYATEDNDCCLDGAIVKIVEVFATDHSNITMLCLFHPNMVKCMSL
jgi:hypothetical protein